MSRTITRTAWPVRGRGERGWRSKRENRRQTVSQLGHSFNALTHAVSVSLSSTAAATAELLGQSSRCLSLSLLFLSLSFSHCQHAHFVADCTSFIWAGSTAILPLPLSLSFSVSWYAGRHLSSFQAAQRIVVSYLCGLLLLFAIFYWSLFGQLTSTTTHTHTHSLPFPHTHR